MHVRSGPSLFRKLIAVSFAVVALVSLGGSAHSQFGFGGGLNSNGDNPSPEPKSKEGRAPAATPPNAEKAEGLQALFPNGLPRLEVFLKLGIERHPDVIVARNKVEAARAELLKAEATALKELMQLHQGVQSKRMEIDQLRLQKAAGTSSVPLQTAAGELSLLEWDIALTLGFMSSKSGGELGTSAKVEQPGEPVAASATVGYVDLAYPKGTHADNIKQNQEMELDLVDASWRDFSNHIAEKTGIPIILDDVGLADIGLETSEAHINLTSKNNPLVSVLQQLEDKHEGLRFVVRDYGILVTTEERFPRDGVTVLDFIKLSEEEIRAKQRAKLEAESHAPPGGGGGFF